MNLGNDVILLAEDDRNDILLFQRALGKTRMMNPVHIVRDGQEAIGYLNGEAPFTDRDRYPLPVLLLLDLKMPRKTGFEVLEWVRGKPGLKRLPAVVLTSSNQSADVNKAYDLGANSYLVKPAGFDALLEIVKSLESYWLELNEKPDLGRKPAVSLM